MSEQNSSSQKRPINILIATPCRDGNVRHEYMMALLNQTFLNTERLQNWQHYNLGFYSTASDSGLGKERGVIASYACRYNFDKLFFIDADMVWSWSDFKKIVTSDKKIIAGVASMKLFPQVLNFTLKPEERHLYEKEKATYKTLLQLPNEEHEVATTGTAFTCIDVSVLKEMADKKLAPAFKSYDSMEGKNVWCYDFFQNGVVNEMYAGEDWGFVIQARRMGVPVHINTSVWVGHVGTHRYVVDGGLYEGDERGLGCEWPKPNDAPNPVDAPVSLSNEERN